MLPPYVRCDGLEIRRIWRCGFPNPQARKGFPKTYTKGIYLNRYFFADYKGTVPNLGDLTTDKYSFVIECPASRHLPMRRKTPPPCRGGGSKSRRGFPPTYHSARETKGLLRPSAWRTKRPLWPPRGKQKGIMAAARRTEGALRPVGVSPPPPLRGSSPCEAGQFIPAGFDCRHSEVCKSRNSAPPNCLNPFFH